MTSFFSISFSRFTLGQIRKVVKSKETLKYIYKSSERVPKKKPTTTKNNKSFAEVFLPKSTVTEFEPVVAIKQ